MLLHAVVDLARDRGLRRVLVATADWALANTDPARVVQRPLFDRVYDGSVGEPFVAARDGRWWVLDVAANAGALVPPRVDSFALSDEPTVCVCHDIERGWGHLDDPSFAALADANADAYLRRMLDVEAEAGVRATYDVVGFLVPELGPVIAERGHAVAFHSFDHADPGEPGADEQLAACRDIDYRMKGYRPAQSFLSPELTDANLAFHNFEWLASSAWSLGIDAPTIANGVVRIPILFDDHDLHLGVDYATWKRAGLQAITGTATAAFSLHDCYGETWLDGYRALLRDVAELGRLRTLDDVAADVILASAL